MRAEPVFVGVLLLADYPKNNTFAGFWLTEGVTTGKICVQHTSERHQTALAQTLSLIRRGGSSKVYAEPAYV